jgi:hypothetical protein
MRNNTKSNTSRTIILKRKSLFDSSGYCLEVLIEQFRARVANLYERWEWYESDRWVVFILKGSGLQLRVKVERKAPTGKLIGRPQIFIFDPEKKSRTNPPKHQINAGAVTWRQNLANAIRLAMPQVHSGSPSWRH